MAKSLCKYRRVEIADQFAKISSLVSEPRFVCSSCARAASDKAYLCKPSALNVRPAAKEESLSTAPVGQPCTALPAGLEAEDAVEPQVSPKKKQLKKLKQLAKKKDKRLKKAARAVNRYEKALAKVQ